MMQWIIWISCSYPSEGPDVRREERRRKFSPAALTWRWDTKKGRGEEDKMGRRKDSGTREKTRKKISQQTQTLTSFTLGLSSDQTVCIFFLLLLLSAATICIFDSVFCWISFQMQLPVTRPKDQKFKGSNHRPSCCSTWAPTTPYCGVGISLHRAPPCGSCPSVHVHVKQQLEQSSDSQQVQISEELGAELQGQRQWSSSVWHHRGYVHLRLQSVVIASWNQGGEWSVETEMSARLHKTDVLTISTITAENEADREEREGQGHRAHQCCPVSCPLSPHLREETHTHRVYTTSAVTVTPSESLLSQQSPLGVVVPTEAVLVPPLLSFNLEGVFLSQLIVTHCD